MINYSVSMMPNPSDPTAPKRAYALSQYTDIMSMSKFAKHISSHGCVYSRADIQAILTLAVDCIHEQLLLGQRIQLGDLGTFSVALHSQGAKTIKDFNAENNIKEVKVVFTPGESFENLRNEAEFNYVLTRKEQAKAIKESKEEE